MSPVQMSGHTTRIAFTGFGGDRQEIVYFHTNAALRRHSCVRSRGDHCGV